MTPLVSVIIVSYNTRELTAQSIRHALDSSGFTKGELEVIVVDNHSTDDTVVYLKNNLPGLKVITNTVNRGFGGGNNQGIKVAKGKYILLLNTDAFLRPHSLRLMVDTLALDMNAVSVGPQLRFDDGRIQSSGGYLPTPLRVLAWMWWLDKLPLVKILFPTPYHVFDPSWHTREQSPDWLMGACILFRRSELLAVGGFDEEIFMYAEEVELYRRLKDNLGKKVIFTPKTHVVHLGGASTKKASAFRLVHELYGVEYIYRKHYPNLYIFVKLVIVVGVLLRIAVYSLLPSRRDALREYFAYFHQS